MAAPDMETTERIDGQRLAGVSGYLPNESTAAASGDGVASQRSRGRDECSLTPYYRDSWVTIYHGDSRKILPLLSGIDAVVSDPPYGFDYDPNRSRKTTSVQRGLKLVDRNWQQIRGESEAFDPAHLLKYRIVLLWGANHYSDALPKSKRWLVWDKRNGVASDNQSDCELAWCSTGGSVRMHRQLWRGISREGAENIVNGEKLHPHQKPIALMKWCIIEAGITTEMTICDPYAGSGTTLRAAKDLGIKSVGIEIEERYCEIAAKRLEQEVLNFTPAVADTQPILAACARGSRSRTEQADNMRTEPIREQQPEVTKGN